MRAAHAVFFCYAVAGVDAGSAKIHISTEMPGAALKNE